MRGRPGRYDTTNEVEHHAHVLADGRLFGCVSLMNTFYSRRATQFSVARTYDPPQTADHKRTDPDATPPTHHPATPTTRNTPTHQHTNTPRHQHTNTPTHPDTNTPTRQHANTPTRHHANTPTRHHNNNTPLNDRPHAHTRTHDRTNERTTGVPPHSVGTPSPSSSRFVSESPRDESGGRPARRYSATLFVTWRFAQGPDK